MIKFVIASNMKVLQIRKEKLKESANLANLDSKKGLKLDVMPRCNSTYLMLESALCYCWVFQHLSLIDFNYVNCPITIERHKVDKICSFLALFYEITCLFSGTKPSTLLQICITFVSSCYITLKYLKDLVNRMLTKF